MSKIDAKRKVKEWFLHPDGETAAECARRLNISEMSIHRWKKEWVDEVKDDPDEEYDPDSYLYERSQKVDKALLRACERTSPGALKIYYQLTKRLVERSENLNIDLTGDDIFNIREKARRELKESGFLGGGTREVPDKPIILPLEIREDTG